MKTLRDYIYNGIDRITRAKYNYNRLEEYYGRTNEYYLNLVSGSYVRIETKHFESDPWKEYFIVKASEVSFPKELVHKVDRLRYRGDVLDHDKLSELIPDYSTTTRYNHEDCQKIEVDTNHDWVLYSKKTPEWLFILKHFVSSLDYYHVSHEKIPSVLTLNTYSLGRKINELCVYKNYNAEIKGFVFANNRLPVNVYSNNSYYESKAREYYNDIKLGGH
tara:strand:+ start:1094 stop:1750 length:657 start_codon:yes stop_codon:yes gene_type:complete